jgi:hypothetical protein
LNSYFFEKKKKEPVEPKGNKDELKSCKIIDDDNLPTFKNLYARMSMRVNKSAENQNEKLSSSQSSATAQSYLSPSDAASKKQTPAAEVAYSAKPLTANINYSNKPPGDLSSYFKCFILAKSGKRSRKKIGTTYRVSLALTKLIFVKEAKKNQLDFFIDIKGGKCVKFESSRTRKGSSDTSTGIAASYNLNLNLTEKERAEIADLVGSKYAFIVSPSLFF